MRETPVQQAKADDLSEILKIMGRANQYVFDKTGEYQWTVKALAHNEIQTHLALGNCFVIKDKRDRIRALVTLTEEDEYSWGHEGKDGKALYFHKLMKDPESSAQQPGLTLLAFAAREALHRSKTYLRCDAKPSMHKLMEYYERLGFRQKRFIRYATSGTRAVLLESDPKEVLRRAGSAQI